jgi:hypothetical protein
VIGSGGGRLHPQTWAEDLRMGAVSCVQTWIMCFGSMRFEAAWMGAYYHLAHYLERILYRYLL